MRIARIAGRRAAYETFGDPQGAPLLIIQGAWGGPSSTLWTGPRLRWPAAGGGLRLIRCDRRCAGRSEYVEQDFSLADLACDAARLLEQLGIERAAVAAASAGGPIALRLALDHPQRVSRLALLGSGAALLHPNPPWLPQPHSGFVQDRLAVVGRRLQMLADAAARGVSAAVRATEHEWRAAPASSAAAGAADPLALFRRRREAALQQLPFAELTRLAAGAMRSMRAQAGIDLTSDLGRIACPVWVVHSRDDSVIPVEFGRALAAALPQAKFSELPGAVHALLDEPPLQRALQRWAAAAARSDS